MKGDKVNMKRKFIVLIAMVLLLTGCIGGTKTGDVGVYVASTSSADQADVSSLNFIDPVMTTAQVNPEQEFKEVWVKLLSIEAKRDDKWETIAVFNEDEGLIDLMSLQFQSQLLGQEITLQAGTYSQIRLVTSDEAGVNKVVLTDDTTHALKIPSNELKPEVGKFTVAAGTVTQLVFDIDMKYFVDTNNGYNANPRKAIALKYLEDFGTLEGEITLPEITIPGLDLENLHFVIGLSQNEQVLFNLALEPGTLKYKFDVIQPGEYDLALSILIGEELEPLVLIATTITIDAQQVAQLPFELIKDHFEAIFK